MSTLEPEPLSLPDTYTTAVLDRQEVEQPVEPGDHERFAHYANKNKVMESALTGSPVVALCGKVWVPSRDPKKFPVCPQCKEIYESRRAGKDGDGDRGDAGGGQAD